MQQWKRIGSGVRNEGMYEILFQTWTLQNWVQTFSEVWSFHTWTMKHKIRRFLNNTELSGAFRWGVVRQVDAGCNNLIPLQRSQVFVYSTSTVTSARIPESSLVVFTGFLCVAPVFPPWDILFFCQFCICQRHQLTQELTMNTFFGYQEEDNDFYGGYLAQVKT